MKTVLSVLIPTYKYPVGLERILETLSPLPEDVEVLVFDDTPEPILQPIIQRFASRMPRLTYSHNPTQKGAALGAGANWNALLDAASGDYVMLLHHDEVPLDLIFLDELRRLLTDAALVDAYMLDLLLVDEDLSPISSHVPSWMRFLVPRYLPNYLFRRNVIGPTGTLVIRNECAPRFDPDLRWLIDVEFYIQLFRRVNHWKFEHNIRVGSVQRTKGTITAELSDCLERIVNAERKILAERYPEANFWLGESLASRFLWIETLAWGGFRGFMWGTAPLKRVFRKSL